MSLTPAQAKLMLFLQREIDATGICPSFEDMQRALGLASKSGVHRITMALIERGFISTLPHRARSIAVLKRVPDPENAHVARAAYRQALKEIAVGEGVYGGQAWEYKSKARKVLERFP